MDYTKLTNEELHDTHYYLSEIVFKRKLTLGSPEHQACLKIQAIYANRLKK